MSIHIKSQRERFSRLRQTLLHLGDESKRLILDRAFLDREAISLRKKKYGIDVLILLRRNMDL